MRTPVILLAVGLIALVIPAVSVGERASEAGPAIRVRVFFPRGNPGSRCDIVYPVGRTIRSPAVLRGAYEALVAGPSRIERQRGYGGWFSARTAGMLRSVRLSHGVARVDFRDFRRVIPNASSSCGSALLLAQLDRTAKQFPGVHRVVYSIDGNARAFYEWLQRSVPAAGPRSVAS